MNASVTTAARIVAATCCDVVHTANVTSARECAYSIVTAAPPHKDEAVGNAFLEPIDVMASSAARSATSFAENTRRVPVSPSRPRSPSSSYSCSAAASSSSRWNSS